MGSIRKYRQKILLPILFTLIGLSNSAQKTCAVTMPLLRMARIFSKTSLKPHIYGLRRRYAKLARPSRRWYLYGYYRGARSGSYYSGVRWPYLYFLWAATIIAVPKSCQAENDPYVLPTKLNEMQFSPSDYEFAFLSSHVYTPKAALEEAQTKNKSQAAPTLEIKVNDNIETLAGWVIDKIFTHPDFTSYQSVLYKNESKKQLILAYQGTNYLKDWLGTNLPGIIRGNAKKGQQTIIGEALKEAIELAKKEGYTISLTGHSLGGWLSQIASFLAHERYLKDIDYAHRMIKAVVFDSPGTKEILEKLNPVLMSLDLGRLDITNYVSTPNKVNELNTHKYMSLYQVVVDKKISNNPLKQDMESHNIDNFVAVFDKHTGGFIPEEAKKVRSMKSWPGHNLEEQGWRSWGYNMLVNVKQPKENLENYDTCYVDNYYIAAQGYPTYRIHKRHIPQHDYEFLREKRAEKKRYIKVLEDTYGARYLSIDKEYPDYVILEDEGRDIISDIRMALDELHNIARKNAHLDKESDEMDSPTVVLPQRLNLSMAPTQEVLFVGRKKQMESLAPYFKKNDELVVLPPITGFGGLGKTQLIHQLIAQHASKYHHIVWINASTKEDIETSYLQIAQKHWGLKPAPSETPMQIIEKVQNKLRNRRVLYVFDDARDLKTIQPYLKTGHIIISSRNNQSIDWRAPYYDAPLALAPFSEEEALAFAKKMGQDTEDPDLIKLIQLLPKYPLVMRQLLSVMDDGNYTPTGFLYEMGRNSELIRQLRINPQKYTTYEASIFEITKIALEGLQSTENGKALLHLVQQLACFDALPIPQSFVLLALGKKGEENQTRHILGDLARNGLIRQGAQKIYMHGITQTVTRELYPLTPEQVQTLVERYVAYDIDKVAAAKLYSTANFGSQMLPHGEKLLAYVQRQRGDDGYTAKCYYKLSRLYLQQGNYQKALSLGQKTLELFQQVIGKNTPNPDIAHVYDHLGEVYHDKGQYTQALSYYQSSLEMKQKVYGDILHADIATSLHNLGEVYYDQGEYTQALGCYQKSLKMREEAYTGKPHAEIASSLHNLSLLYRSQAQYKQALYYGKKSFEMYAAIYGNSAHPDIATCFDNLGVVAYHQAQYKQALEYYQKSLEMKQKIYGEGPHPSVASSYNNLGAVSHQQGQYTQALDYYQKALKVYKEIYGDISHPSISTALHNLGRVYRIQGKDEQALAHYQKSFEMDKVVYGERPHPDIASSYDNLGNAYNSEGEYVQAIEYYQKALKMRVAVYEGKPHPSIATSYRNLGKSYNSQGQYEQALDYYQKSLKMDKEIYKDKPHPSIATSLHNLGAFYHHQGKYAHAIEYYQKALDMRAAVYGDTRHSGIATSLHNIGTAYYDQGQYAQALDYYQKSLDTYQAVYGDIPHPNIATALHNLSGAYRAQWRFIKASMCFLKAKKVEAKYKAMTTHT